MKVWITKYALTGGIFVTEIKDEYANSDFVSIRMDSMSYCGTMKEDRHTTWESAKERAEEMKIKKLQSLDKQSKKISALEFSDPDKA